MLVHFALALLLSAPALHPARHAIPGSQTGLRARDAVEIGLAHHRDGAQIELGPRLRHPSQPPRAGTDASPFAAARADELVASTSSAEPAHVSAPDPRGARRPAYYATAPPLPGRFLS